MSFYEFATTKFFIYFYWQNYICYSKEHWPWSKNITVSTVSFGNNINSSQFYSFLLTTKPTLYFKCLSN